MAAAALDGLDLDEVLLVPMGQAPHREIEADPGAEVRLEMTRFAVEDCDRVGVDTFEVDSADRPSYTYLTLEHLHGRYPEAELILLLGGDAAATLDRWENPQRILELASVAVAERDGVGAAPAASAMRRIDSDAEAKRIELEPVDVSSTDVRRRFAKGEDVRTLVGDRVARLIERQGLYRE